MYRQKNYYAVDSLNDKFGWSEQEKQKTVYVPRVEDRFSNMKMLKISSLNDLVLSSMDILEPPPVDSDGKEREDGILIDALFFVIPTFIITVKMLKLICIGLV